jgi:hypothetical protein
MLQDRVRDKGISVRKCVVKIFRLYVVNAIFDVNNQLVSRALQLLVERLGDSLEEESVKEAILTTFQEVWFNCRTEANDSDVDHFNQSNSNTRKQKSSRSWAIKNTTSNSNNTIVPSSVLKKTSMEKFNTYDQMRVVTMMEVIQHVSKSDWFVALIRRLSSKATATNIDECCNSVVSGLMEVLLNLEAGETNKLPQMTLKGVVLDFNIFVGYCFD